MYRGNSSRFFPLILVLIIIIIAVVVLVSVGKAIFGGHEMSNQTPADTGTQTLLETSVDHSVRMTVRGPIVANEKFRSYRIAISPDERSLTQYSGYLQQVTDTKTLGNNTKAYEEFVYALARAEFMDSEAFSGDKDDTRGVCPAGDLYEFDVVEDDSSVKRLWTTTCRSAQGSFTGNLGQIRGLFLKQIPGSEERISSVDL